ncbi:MAG: sulfur carrier protein ThiS [Gammaproteobacteria bacterium]
MTQAQTCIVNGETTAIGGGGITIAELLRRLGLTGRKIAVEKNGAIVSKSRHDTECIRGGDKLEVITAVGGG